MSKPTLQNETPQKQLVNYEQECARRGIEIVENCAGKKLKKNEVIGTLNKATGVLQSSGIYAFVIWLKYRVVSGSDQTAVQIQNKVYELIGLFIRELKPGVQNDVKDTDKVKQFINHETVSIEELYLLKGLLQKMLVYGLYAAKALEISNADESQAQKGTGR